MSRSSPAAPCFLPARALALASALLFAPWSGTRAQADPPPGPPSIEAFAVTFPRQLDDDDGTVRLAAMERAAAVREPAVVDLLVTGVAREIVRRSAGKKAQGAAAAALEGALTEITKMNGHQLGDPKQIDWYNKRMPKLEAKRDEANARLRELAVDQIMGRSIVGAGVRSIATVLDALETTAATRAFERVTAAWTGPKSTTGDRIRWADVASAVKQHPFAARLHAVVADEKADPRVRIAALEGEIARGEPTALADAIACLASPAWNLVAAAVAGLGRLHQREAIEPLIELMGRKDAGRLRQDAQRALRSLTGQAHGPYQQPWRAWWEGAKATFQLPPAPTDEASAAPEKGVSFFGITSTSDRVLYILDVSGSMNELAHPDAAGTRAEVKRIELARKELAGSIDLLDASKTFNLILFSHRVIRWQAAPAQADKGEVARAKKFATDTEADGGTNIHDALETAFEAATTGPDGKSPGLSFDTFFFMTDGTPTAGKLQTPDEILAAVREWNRTARIVIHCIGVGEAADAAFLGALARETGGVFVKR